MDIPWPAPEKLAPAASPAASRAYKGPARDTGPPEAQAKRLALVNGSANTALAFTLPDILFAHQILDREQWGTALRFRSLRARVFGVPLANATPGPEPDEDRIAENERKYAKALEVLTVEQQLAVVDVALDLRPGWIRREIMKLPLGEDDRTERAALVAGLDALARS